METLSFNAFVNTHSTAVIIHSSSGLDKVDLGSQSSQAGHIDNANTVVFPPSVTSAFYLG